MHADSCPIYQARTMIQRGVDVRNIRILLDSQARSLGIPIPPEVDEFLVGQGAPRKYYYSEELPSNEKCLIEGRVHEINQVNFFKRFDLDDNLIIRKLLGQLAAESHVEIIAREVTKTNARIIRFWRFFMPEEYTSGLKIGTVISATLLGKSILGDDERAIWTVEDINW